MNVPANVPAVPDLSAAYAPRGPGEPPARLLLVPGDLPDAAAQERLRAALPAEEPLVEALDDEVSVITLPHRTVPLTEALDAVEPARNVAAALSALLDGAPVEPDLPRPGSPARVERAAGLEGVDPFAPGCWTGEEKWVDDDPRWALRMIRAPEAWALSEAQGRRSGGDGIVVAQPDTGVADHRQLDDVVRAGGRNTLGDGPEDDPTDPLQRGFALNPGHGTATASVLLSPEADPSDAVVGSAPRALHLPVRAIRSVWLHEEVPIARAVDWAVERGAHVVSMSLGGLVAPVSPLRRAIRRAVERDVIVMAAAGNCVDVVVYPARFPECLAVAGVDAAGRKWPGSCSGPAVDVAAPAQNVVRAAVGEGGVRSVGQGEGTSYAVALTAGVAALWLAHHGRDALVAEARRRRETLQAMFRRLVRATARRDRGWDGVNMGAGIVDAVRLLEAPLDLGLGTESPARLGGPGDTASDLRALVGELLGADPGLPDAVVAAHGTDLAGALVAARLRRGPVPEKRGAGLAAPALATGFEALPPEQARRADVLRRGFASGKAVADTGRLEGAAEARALPSRAALEERLDALAERMPTREVKDRAAFLRALRLLREHAGPGIAKLPDPQAPLSRAELGALEAVVKADGSRPSLLVREGWIAEDHPFIGGWADPLVGARPRLKELVGLCGRVQPTGGHASRYAGTATLLDEAGPWALTNFHVLAQARESYPVIATRTARGLSIARGLEVDFLGEDESADSNRWTVVEAVYPNRAGENFGFVDAVMLRLGRSLDGKELPLPRRDADGVRQMPTLSRSARYVNGQSPDFVTVGFPYEPKVRDGVVDGIDWNWVVRTLFGDTFGVKRLAPGSFYQGLGSHALDQATRYAFGHDATTLHGASGSLLFSLKDAGAPAFGLHFVGFDNESNWALSVPTLADAFAGLDVPLP